MEILTCKVDGKGRVTLPADFAGAYVYVERAGEHELVLRKATLMPPRRRKYRLRDLLKGVTKENLHAKLDLGKPVGKELM